MGAESAREWHSWVLKASVSGTRGSGKPSDFRHMSSAKRSQPSDLNQVAIKALFGILQVGVLYIYIYICICTVSLQALQACPNGIVRELYSGHKGS